MNDRVLFPALDIALEFDVTWFTAMCLDNEVLGTLCMGWEL